MIKYEDAEVVSVLPPFFKENTDVQAISYAIKMGINKLISFSKATALYADIDVLSEELLDLLALELRTQYYEEGLDVETKRQLIKNTLIWYEKAGTPAAVGELVATVFGEGKVEEWFEYGGDPYLFRIITNAALTPEMNTIFNQMVQQIKNARSHLESISITRTIRQWEFAGAGQAFYTRSPAIREGAYKDRKQEQMILAGAETTTSYIKTEAIKQAGGETYATTV